jgi:hypothetical protein
MDKERFDSLARALAIGKSRRDVLKLLAGGAAGGALVVTAFDDAAAECHGIACSDDTGCCNGAPYCVSGVCAVQMAAEAPAEEETTTEQASGGTTTATTVPNTGIGPEGAGSGAWMGAALAGGAAALFASKVLRRDQSEAEDSA